MTLPYAELQATSNFTFLTGGSHPQELVRQAAALGHEGVGITDRNSLAGIVRAHMAAKEAGLPLIVGCRAEVGGSGPVAERPGRQGGTGSQTKDSATGAPGHPATSYLLYPTELASYGRLCRLLTRGKMRAGKGGCELYLHDLIEHQEGLLAIAIPPAVVDEKYINTLLYLRQVFGDRLSLGASFRYGPDDRDRLRRIADLAGHTRVPLVATGDVLYHAPERKALQDVLTCIRLGCTLEEAGTRLAPHAQRHLKPPNEMARLFRDYPRAIVRSAEIARQARGFSLDQIRYHYPAEVVPASRTPMQHLAELTRSGAAWRYPGGVPEKVERQIEHELKLIEELNYPHYFLTVHDMVEFARGRGILCQGRGAAANSAVCYCLGLTSVDPERVNVLFERFVSRERGEPPDIDIDFEHQRREEVIQYLYQKYGRDRAALTAEVITYRGRSAVREVGKALGLSLDAVDRLAKALDRWTGGPGEEMLEQAGLDPGDPLLRHLAHLTREIHRFPRHLSQHVGGFVLTDKPLCELVPIENAAMPGRSVIEWDKDDIDDLGLLKVDVLGLGMLSSIRRCFELVEKHHGQALTLANIPPGDPGTYDMICEADTVGVFQIESRAQMNMLPRLRPRCWYDLVIEVAIVRPGPIYGDMVHPYLRRRRGEEPVSFPSAAAERILGKTLGVPLFQEQAMRLAIECAGFTPDEADRLRRAMAKRELQAGAGRALHPFGRKLIGGMIESGHPRAFAEACYKQIQGFSEYGFPESHAASFALLVYVSAWLKRHHPAAFTCALLNSQPMGFYAPAQLVRDAREHGVEVRPADVHHSAWDCTLEPIGDGLRPGLTLRLGLRQVRGLREEEADRIAAAAGEQGRFGSIESLWRVSGVSVSSLRQLARADAFRSLGLSRQQALWQVGKLRDAPAPLFGAIRDRQGEDAASLPRVTAWREVAQDYRQTGLSLRPHPISFLRGWLERENVAPVGELRDEQAWPHGSPVQVAGLCLLRQRPSTAKGITFMTLEDETGSANLIVRRHVYDACRAAAHGSTAMIVRGRVERQGPVVHVVASHLRSLDAELGALHHLSRDFH
ncbi:MAG: error-prone DNA polymerase [Phycisphaeraceae bacterium]